MKDTTKKTLYSILIVMLFVVSFFVVRIPLLTEPIGFEEGIFAELITHQPEGPFYELKGRIDGENMYVYISHPAVPYELLRLGGCAAQGFLSEEVYLDDLRITPRLRIISSMYQLIFWGLLLLYALKNRKAFGYWPILLIFIVMLSPLAIKTSMHLQIDNTGGVILCGIAALLFVTGGRENQISTKVYLLLLAGGFLAGLGKQEWSFALVGGLIAALCTLLFVKYELSKSQCIRMVGCIAGGLLLGNIASYLYDPENYSRGLYYIVHFSKLHESSAGDWNFAHWMMLMGKRLPFILICLVLLLPIFYSYTFQRSRKFLFYLVSFYGISLLLGYILSDWNARPRYFCPALAVLTVAAMVLCSTPMATWFRASLLGGITVVFASMLFFINGFVPDRNRDLEQINSGRLKSSPGTVLYIKSGAGWNKPHLDYINNNNNVSYDQLKIDISEKYGKRLVKPEDVVQDSMILKE